MVEKLWDYLTDPENKALGKLVIAAIAIIGLLSVDYFFRLSDSYIAEKKIEQIGKIEQILKEDSLRDESKKELIRIENQVIARQGFWDFLASLTQSTTSSPKQKTTTPIATKPIIKDSLSKDTSKSKVTNISDKSNELSLFWHVLSSSWIFILLMAIAPVTPFIPNGKGKVTFANVLAFEILLAILSAFYSFILHFIPVFSNVFWNYAINVFSIPIMIMLLAFFGTKRN